MNIKYFNTLKALEKYSGHTEQFFVLLFSFFTLVTGIFVFTKLPSDILVYLFLLNYHLIWNGIDYSE